jgi:hypothetical protein
MPPNWLPSLKIYNGDWGTYVDEIYPVFKKDFVDSQPLYSGKPVFIIREPLLGGKEHSFWHVTSKGEDESSRIPDFRRCERIGWIRPVIDNANDPCLKCWDELRGGKLRAHLWLESQEFLVVLEKRPKWFFLVTAFHVPGEHARIKYQKRFEKANTAL